MFGKDFSVLSMDENLFLDFNDLEGLKFGTNLFEVINPADKTSFGKNWNAVLDNTLTHFSFEGVISASGTLKNGCMFIQSFPDKDGEKTFIQGILTISDFSPGDNPREIISSLFQHNPLPFYCFDLDGKFIQVNQKLIEFTGLNEETLLTLSYSDFIHPDDLPQTDEYFKQALNGVSNQYELRVVLADKQTKRIRVNKFPRMVEGEVTGVYGVFEDITERYESEQRWKNLIEQNPLPVVVFIDRKFVFINPAAAKFYGVKDAQELIGADLLTFVPEEERELLLRREQQLLNNEKLNPRETRILSKDNKIRNIIVHPRTIIYEGKKAIQSVLFDITELKQQKVLVEKSLKEKETLLKEIHHRVKNNLAIISGLIELQIQNIKDQATIDVLRDSQNRIQSIALVHQKLYQFESLDAIDLGKYIEELLENLNESFRNPQGVDINIYAEEVILNIEQAIPCSLIINEVIVNSFKHAFENISEPSLVIDIRKNEEHITVKVSDNGVGIKKKEDFEIKDGMSLGTTLIAILSQQLGGTYNYLEAEKPGAHFLLTFPTKQH